MNSNIPIKINNLISDIFITKIVEGRFDIPGLIKGASILGFSMISAIIIEKQINSNPEKIYTVSGTMIGIPLGVIFGAYSRFNISTKTYKTKLINILFNSVLSNILGLILKPLQKVVDKIVGKIYQLPKYEHVLEKIDAKPNTNSGSKLFLSFITRLILGLIGGYLISGYVGRLIQSKIDIKSIDKDILKTEINESINQQNFKKVANIPSAIGAGVSVAGVVNTLGDNFPRFNVQARLSNYLNTSPKRTISPSVNNKMSADESKKLDELRKKFLETLLEATNRIYIYDFECYCTTQTAITLLDVLTTYIAEPIRNVSKKTKHKLNGIHLVFPGTSTDKIAQNGVALENAAMDIVNNVLYVIIKPAYSQDDRFTPEEIEAVIAHEFGHYLTKQRAFLSNILVLTVFNLAFPSKSSLVYNITSGAISHISMVYGRYQEIQADKFASNLGYTRHLAEALRKLVQINKDAIPTLSTKDTYEVHSTFKLRYDALMKLANKKNQK